MSIPCISVILPVFNSAGFVGGALESILGQSFKDFEVIVIDDGSTDDSLEVVNSFKDERIIVLRNAKNLGLVESLNKAVEYCKGKYIARMDADDICASDRLKIQYDFMEAHPDVDVAGTYLLTFGAIEQSWQPPTSHEDIHCGMLFSNMIYHPTVIAKSYVFKEKYDPSFLASEDYELWLRLINKGYRFANVPEFLLRYRVHENKVGKVFSNFQEKNSYRLAVQNFTKFGIKLNEEDYWLSKALVGGFDLNLKQLNKLREFLNTLLKENRKQNIYCNERLYGFVSEKWFRLCLNLSGGGVRVLLIYLLGPRVGTIKPNFKILLRMLKRAIWR